MSLVLFLTLWDSTPRKFETFLYYYFLNLLLFYVYILFIFKMSNYGGGKCIWIRQCSNEITYPTGSNTDVSSKSFLGQILSSHSLFSPSDGSSSSSSSFFYVCIEYDYSYGGDTGQGFMPNTSPDKTDKKVS